MIIAIFVLAIFLFIASIVSLSTDKSLLPLLLIPLAIAISTISAWALAPLCGVIFLISEIIIVFLSMFILYKLG